MSDLLHGIRRELDDRMAALKPAADEFARLRRAADALDGAVSPATTTRPAASPRAARARPAPRRGEVRKAGERAAPGQTQLRVIEQLRNAPGSSSTAVAQALGISANAAAATISRLVKQRRVSRLETGGYAAAESRPAERGPQPSAPPSGAESSES